MKREYKGLEENKKKKKKRTLKHSWKATEVWNRNDWFDCCEFNLCCFQVSQ